MEQLELWHILLALAILAVLVEIFTLGFLAGALGVGLVFASVGAYFEADTEWLIALFAAGSVLAFFTIQPLVNRFIQDKITTNADAIVGQKGRVTEEVDPARGTGRASVGGDDWKVESDQVIAVGTQVEVVSRNSIVLQVIPIKQ